MTHETAFNLSQKLSGEELDWLLENHPGKWTVHDETPGVPPVVELEHVSNDDPGGYYHSDDIINVSYANGPDSPVLVIKVPLI